MATVSNVYVGNLPPHCDDMALKTLFEGLGPISSCKVIMDLKENISKGYGFVQFVSPVSASLAVQSFNGAEIEGGKKLTVKFADHDAGNYKSAKVIKPTSTAPVIATPAPTDNSSSRNSIYVSGIPTEWKIDVVKQLFSSFGTIASGTVLTNKATGASRGAALLRFEDATEAATAIGSLNGALLQGMNTPMTVKLADNNKPSNNATAPLTTNSTSSLRYTPYPQVSAAPPPSQSAIVAAVLQRIAAMNKVLPIPPQNLPPLPPLTFPVAPVVLAPAAPAQEGLIAVPRANKVPEEESNLYVCGLDPQVTSLHLYEAFAPYGAVNSVKIMLDRETKQPKGFGFVQFLLHDDAAAAIEGLHGALVGTKTWSVTFHRKK